MLCVNSSSRFTKKGGSYKLVAFESADLKMATLKTKYVYLILKITIHVQ